MSDAYPDMRIEQGTAEESVDKLLAVGEMNRYLHAEICRPSPKDERSIILANLTMRNAMELEELAHAFDKATEIIAWRARNLFELNLRTRYLIRNPDAIDELIAEVYSDDINLLEGLIEMMSGSPEEQEFIRKRQQHQKDVLTKRGLKPVKYKTILDLAKNVDVLPEYQMFYKLYSKYVHPSAFLIGQLKVAALWDKYARRVLIMNGYTYAVDTMKRITATTGLPFRPV